MDGAGDGGIGGSDCSTPNGRTANDAAAGLVKRDDVKMASSRKRKRQQRSNITMWLIAGAVGAVLLVALLVWANQPTPVAGAALDKCGRPECGQANAPVTVEEYSDFQ